MKEEPKEVLDQTDLQPKGKGKGKGRRRLSTNPIVKRWEKPLKGHVKINFDALVCNNGVGYGVIARDKDGFVLGGGGGFKDEMMSVDEAES
ncbi:hypothetical protein Gogos_000064 [Gossypium gossypioides]|uniref:RNase H type-1 domain-containing protein n=1 Tax=Gossypium gossypioides TaxID=34282 RepID=A0A7J9D336_GOSGO|nr:hypothetical protein [Gossypium gossypioides]